MLRRLNKLVTLKAFARDARGVSALEFALVAPILIMLYLAMLELTLGIMARRRAAHLGASIGDLASQSESLTMANINDLWNIGTSLMTPFETGNSLKITLSSVVMDATGKNATYDWSETHNGTKHAKTETVPTTITAQMSANDSLIVTEVEYDYTSPIGNFLPGTSVFKYVYYHHPRSGAEVTCPDCT